jgi:pimeloyl-ACP methyl ester carboxylesterase
MFPEPGFVDTNDIRMAVYEQGEGPAVIMVHGFPELAFSWRHQLPALAEAGFRAIAPDMRGYGQTDSPAGVDAYRASELIGDLVGLLDSLELQRAVFVGHDWGALVLWQMAMLAPARIEKLIALNIPHLPRMPIDPITLMRERLGDDFYIVNFQDSDEADRVFATDPAHFFDIMIRKNQVTREVFDTFPPERKVLSLLSAFARKKSSGQAILSDKERDYYVEAYTRSGFTGPINWYRNWSQNWVSTEGVEQFVRVPTLFIGAHDDVVVALHHIESMKAHVENLEVHVLRPCGHWTQQERADDVNTLIIDWLSKHSPA